MDLREQLQRDEGIRLKAYLDSVGKCTIGIGHNLEDRPISLRAALLILEDDIMETHAALTNAMPWFSDLDEVRQGAILNMAFNLGISGLLEFHRMLTAVQMRDWEGAAKEMLASAWANQVGDRAIRLAQQMQKGEWQ